MSEANKALIRRLLQECFNQHNVDLYPEYYSENFVQSTPAMGKLGAELSRLSWKWRKRSSVKIAERTYEKRAQALHC